MVSLMRFLGLALATDTTHSRGLHPARENNSALESLEEYIVWVFGN